LKVGTIGYNTETLILNSESREFDTLISLSRKELFLDNITVEGNKSEIIRIDKKTSLNIIEVNNFSSLPSLGVKDLSRSLQLLPGIATSNYGSSGLHIRNGLPSENLILLDGISLYHHNHTFGFFNAINPDAIKDVRVYKGGFPAKYGDRLSGVLEMTTKTGNFSKPKIKISANQVNFNAVGEIPIAGIGAALVSYRQSYRDKFLVNIYDRVYKTIKGKISHYNYDEEFLFEEEDNSANDASFYDLLGKLTIVPTQNDFVSFSFYSGLDKAKSEADIPGTEIDPTHVRNAENLEWNNYGFSGSWFRTWSKSLNTSLLLSKSKYSTEKEITDIITYSQDESQTDSINQNLYLSTTNDANDFTLQLRNELSTSLGFFEFGVSHKKIDLNFNDIYIDNDTYSYKFNQDSSASLSTFYLQNTFNLISSLETTMGMRSTYYSLSNKNFIEPRISFIYNFYSNLNLKGAWGQYRQYLIQPSGYDVINFDGQNSWILADGQITKPGFSEHLVAGLQFEDEEYLFDAEFYYKKNNGLDNIYGNRQFLIRDDQFYDFEMTTVSKGIDFILQKKKGNINGWLSYSLGEAVSEVDRNFEKIKFSSDQDIRHNLKAVINYNYKNFIFSLTGQLVSGLPYSTPDVETTIYDPEYPEFKTYIFYAPPNRNSDRLPVIKRIDFSASYLFDYKWIKGKVGFSIFNLFDNKNVWHRYFKISNEKLTPVDVNMLGFTPTFFAEISF